jgi:hypothetical protein
MSIWLPLAIGVLTLTGVMILLGLRWPKPISRESRAQALLDRVLKMEGDGDLKQAAWLCRQAMEEDPGNTKISDRLYDLYWRIGIAAQARGDLTEAQLYLALIQPEFSLYSEVESLRERLIRKEPLSLETGGNTLPTVDLYKSLGGEVQPDCPDQEGGGTPSKQKESDEPA